MVDPATIPAGMRKCIEDSTTLHAAMKLETGEETGEEATISSSDYICRESNPTVTVNPVRFSHQTSTSGLRHNSISDSASAGINTTNAYQRIQAYKPPAYVSPYGAPQLIRPETNEVEIQSIREPNVPRLPSKGEPAWICCFAQKIIPEWSRHAEIWNTGTEGVCTAYLCQHKKCEDCLWESLESVAGGISVQSRPKSRQTKIGEEKGLIGDEEAVDETNMAETALMMAPPGIPSWRGINRDPRTGRPRLWAKN